MDVEQARGATPERPRNQRRQTLDRAPPPPPINEPPANVVRSKEIAARIRSIDHFVFLFGNEGRYYMPPTSLITWHFVRQVISGEKQLLKQDRINGNFTVPKSRGFHVGTAFQEMSDDQEFMSFFPDATPKSNVPREYFLTVTSLAAAHSSSREVQARHGLSEHRAEEDRQAVVREASRHDQRGRRDPFALQRGRLLLPVTWSKQVGSKRAQSSANI